jgi:hypothetical protein
MTSAGFVDAMALFVTSYPLFDRLELPSDGSASKLGDEAKAI